MRPAITVTVAVAVLAVSACGSQTRVSSTPPPRLARTVAASLAYRSDVLAAALRRGDSCGARTEVHGLERQTRLAIAAGGVPVPYRARLLAAVRSLAARVPHCAPPPPPPAPPPPEHHKGGGE